VKDEPLQALWDAGLLGISYSSSGGYFLPSDMYTLLSTFIRKGGGDLPRKSGPPSLKTGEVKWEDCGPPATHFLDNARFTGTGLRPIGYQLVGEKQIRDFNPLRIQRARVDKTRWNFVLMDKGKEELPYFSIPMLNEAKSWIGLEVLSENIVREYVTNSYPLGDYFHNLCSYTLVADPS
jgi:hypothetical protein